MRAIVLLGGQGTRLRPLTLFSPKQALPIAEESMIARVLAHLEAHGITEAVLSLGYRPDAFVELFPTAQAGGVALTYVVEPEPLDTAGAIAFAADAAGIESTFVVVNGDVLTDLDVSAMVEAHRRTGAEATISLAQVDDPSAFGMAQVGPDDQVSGFVEKPPPSTHRGPGWVNAGTYVVEPEALARIERGRRVSVEREVFPGLVADGRLFGFRSHDYWTDTGTPAQYLAAQLDLLDGKRPGPPNSTAADADSDGRWLVGSPRIDGEVVGPSLIGDGARIERGALVTRSVIGSGCVVMAGAEIRNSVLLPGATIHEGAQVEGSIIGTEAIVGVKARVTDRSVVGPQASVPAGAALEGQLVPAAQ